MKPKFGKNKSATENKNMKKKDGTMNQENVKETNQAGVEVDDASCDSCDGNTQPENLEVVCKELTEKLSDTNDKLLRKVAEFDNFKKRTNKEKIENFSLGICEAVDKLLPVLDNFDRAILAAETNDDKELLLEGIKMIKKQLDDALTEIGVCEIEAVGNEFDAEKHNAVMMEDSDLPPNTVTEEFAKGYLFKKGDNERVIRHSMVKVSN